MNDKETNTTETTDAADEPPPPPRKKKRTIDSLLLDAPQRHLLRPLSHPRHDRLLGRPPPGGSGRPALVARRLPELGRRGLVGQRLLARDLLLVFWGRHLAEFLGRTNPGALPRLQSEDTVNTLEDEHDNNNHSFHSDDSETQQNNKRSLFSKLTLQRIPRSFSHHTQLLHPF